MNTLKMAFFYMKTESAKGTEEEKKERKNVINKIESDYINGAIALFGTDEEKKKALIMLSEEKELSIKKIVEKPFFAGSVNIKKDDISYHDIKIVQSKYVTYYEDKNLDVEIIKCIHNSIGKEIEMVTYDIYLMLEIKRIKQYDTLKENIIINIYDGEKKLIGCFSCRLVDLGKKIEELRDYGTGLLRPDIAVIRNEIERSIRFIDVEMVYNLDENIKEAIEDIIEKVINYIKGQNINTINIDNLGELYIFNDFDELLQNWGYVDTGKIRKALIENKYTHASIGRNKYKMTDGLYVTAFYKTKLDQFGIGDENHIGN